jgi:hypothetical protein
MQKLRILFYGDRRVDDSPVPLSFGTSDLSRFISEGLKNVADVKVTFVHRHQRNPLTNEFVEGANKLAWQFLLNYDEIWIFGDRMQNSAGKDVKTAQPYNTLDEYEQAVLREWMKSNGVLLTGDHSEFPDPPSTGNVCDQNHSKFIALGASLGRFVPRAHQLRVWDGAPTNCPDVPHDNQNTVDGPDPSKLDSDGEALQFDRLPQFLVNPSTAHKLFSWVTPAGQVVPITVFPDHQHEGRVRAPGAQELDADWPTGSPLPEVVASGKDKRPFVSGREYALVVAFDGDPVSIGRIVADSSFHHYLNINLSQLNGRDSSGSPLPGTELGQIAQYYCNLALWLAPKSIRDAIKLDLFSNLATHPLVQSAKGMGIERLGSAARRAAEVEVGASNLFQIFGLASQNGGPVDDLLSTAFLAEAPTAAPTPPAAGDPSQPRADMVLGAIVQEFYDFFSSQGKSSSGDDEAVPRAEIVNRGFARAFRS